MGFKVHLSSLTSGWFFGGLKGSTFTGNTILWFVEVNTPYQRMLSPGQQFLLKIPFQQEAQGNFFLPFLQDAGEVKAIFERFHGKQQGS